jgi:hypothetical protein
MTVLKNSAGISALKKERRKILSEKLTIFFIRNVQQS